MHDAGVSAFRIYDQHGEDAAKRGGWRPCIKYTSPNTTSQINIIRNTTVFIRYLVNTLVGSKLLFTCIGHGNITCFVAI